MKGNIYTSQKCPVCNGVMIHDERRNNCICPKCGIPASKGYLVRFGREICKRFPSYQQAAQFLNGIRFKSAEGSYDRRDYAKDFPLGLHQQADAWLEKKKLEVKPRSWNNLNNYIQKAKVSIGNVNVKNIGYKELEDFLFGPSFKSEKTRSNACSCLRDFFTWVKRREGIQLPEFPECKFELGWRSYTDWETQDSIIERIREISYELNPKIWFGVVLLATYTALRPDDLRRLSESDFNSQHGILTIQNPTKKKNGSKIIRLIEDHAETWRQIKSDFPGLPSMPFFRHVCGRPGTPSGTQFGPKYLKVWWDRACADLGITGLDLYGGTRHTTTTELARIEGRDNAKKATGHDTNRAFERYCQAQDETAFQMAKVVAGRKKQAEIISFEKKGC